MLKENSKIPFIAYKRTDLNKINFLPDVSGVLYEDIKSLKNLGFEASNLYKAYDLWSKAIKTDHKIVLGFTSNAISCGLRDIITLLCKHKLVDIVFTTGGGIEEDIIKSKIPAKIDLKTKEDSLLHEAGINRTQNLYFSNDSYVYLETFLKDVFKKNSFLESTTVKELTRVLGDNVEAESSFLYWCSKNQIPVLAGGLEDCAIGDYYAIQNFKNKQQKKPPLVLNSACTLTDYLEFLFADQRKIFAIILGGGFVKHMIMNGCIAKGGADSAVYMNNEFFYTGSNAGAPLSEAISWGKLKPHSLNESVKVHGDYLLPFYLLATQIVKQKVTPIL